MKRKPIFLFSLIALLFLSGGIAAAQAKVVDFVGKVEIKPPNGSWTPAKQGMAIAVQSMISTGFKSKATIELDQSTLFVNQLTRLTLLELARNQNTINTNLQIDAGSLAADVKPGGNAYEHVFNVKSPVATAAVRGTSITFDGNELTVKSATHTVRLFNLLNQPMTVFPGEAALTGTGLDLTDSLQLRDLRFRIRLSLRRPILSTVETEKSLSSDSIVVFYTIW